MKVAQRRTSSPDRAHRIPAKGYFDDVNGLPAYRRHVNHYFAEQIRAELADPDSLHFGNGILS